MNAFPILIPINQDGNFFWNEKNPGFKPKKLGNLSKAFVHRSVQQE